jgi:hypothetical protein
MFAGVGPRLTKTLTRPCAAETKLDSLFPTTMSTYWAVLLFHLFAVAVNASQTVFRTPPGPRCAFEPLAIDCSCALITLF